MARKLVKKEDRFKSNYPSMFGSHSSMIDEHATERLEDDSLVVLKDEIGLYLTERVRLDNGLADVNRFGSTDARQKKLIEAGVVL